MRDPSQAYTYTFQPHATCMMCDDPVAGHQVLGKRLNRSQGKAPARTKGITTTVVRCTNCGLIYADPLPMPANLGQHYGAPPKEYWKMAEHFDLEDTRRHTQPRYRKILDYTRGLSDHPKALDIGFGIGRSMLILEEYGFEAWGVEPGEYFRDFAIKTYNLPEERCKSVSIEQAEFESEMFDYISFEAVFEHLYNPLEALAKVHAWMKPGGLVFIDVPNADWLTHKLSNLYYRVRGLDYVANLSPMHVPYHLYEFSEQSFQQAAKRLNFELLDIDYYVRQTYLPKPFGALLTPWMRWRNQGMQLDAWLRKPLR